MKKLLHERLREHADLGCLSLSGLGYDVALWPKEARAIADEIERYYIPRPRFDDGEPVQFSDSVVTKTDGSTEPVTRISFTRKGFYFNSSKGNVKRYEYGEPVKRPSPKVLDADGVEIKVGDTVWDTRNGGRFEVASVSPERLELLYRVNGIGGISTSWINASEVTHKEPVFDTDDVPIRVGDTVWSIDGEKFKVADIDNTYPLSVKLTQDDKLIGWNSGEYLTHKEPDSREKALNDMARQMKDWHKYDFDNEAELMEQLNVFADRLAALVERGA